MGNKAHKAAALGPGISGLEGGGGLDRDSSTLSLGRGVSTTSTAGGGGGGGAAAEADDSVLHFEHTFQATYLEPAGADAEEEEAAAAEELLGLPMPKGDGPGAPPTHHVYPPGHPHHLMPHQQGPPLHQRSSGEQQAGGTDARPPPYRPRPVRITLVGDRLQVEEDAVLLNKAKPPPVLVASFAEVSEICWDHSHSSVKLLLDPDSGAVATTNNNNGAATGAEGNGNGKRQFIFALPNSLEMEQEVKQRVTVLRRLRLLKRAVPFQYIGMFAGPTKPKPFQRKRATLSASGKLKPGAMPTLDAMKAAALRQYQGAAVPVPTLASRRLDVALQHIHKGFVSFPVLRASHLAQPGVGVGAAGINDTAQLRVDYEGVQYIHDGFRGFQDTREGGTDLKIPFSALAGWEAVDEHPLGSSQNGVVLRPADPARWGIKSGECFFQVRFAADARHVLEFFWNAFRLQQGLDPMPGSTHGRVVEEVYTVTGATARPAVPKGSLRVTDANGRLVCDLGEDDSSSSSAGAAGTASGHANHHHRRAPPERAEARGYWGKVVMHQGWLMKKGGFSKKWLRRYFVLYRTCMGHILCYYADHTETALYTEHPQERNVIDCCKVEFIRPVSSTPETPPHAFDIQSVMREWTVCANDQADLQRWLRLLAYAVDADVAVLPDDEVSFMVKPRHDPTMKLYLDEYSTCLRIHAYGVSVDVVEGESRTRVFLWPYTDLYKWTILSQKGKIALQLTVFTSDDYAKRTEFIFRTRNAPRIASVIEYFLEKYMNVMHLSLEAGPSSSSPGGGGGGSEPEAPAKQSRVASLKAASSSVSAASGGGGSGGERPPSPMYRRESSSGLDGGDDGDEEGGGGGGGGNGGGGGGGGAWASDGEDGDDDRQKDFMEGLDAQQRPPGAAAGGVYDNELLARDGSGQSLGGAGGSPVASPPPPEPCLSPPPAPSHFVPKGIDAAVKARMAGWATALAAAGQGTLFESEVLQVLCRQEFHGHQGHLQLLYKNLGPVPLESFHGTASSNTAGLLIQAHAPAASRLAPQEQTAQTLRVLCMEPFDPVCASTGEPAVSISLEFNTAAASSSSRGSPTLGGASPAHYTYPLPLPVSVLHFISPLVMDRAAFLSQWQAITAPEVRDTFAVQPSSSSTTNQPSQPPPGTRYAQADALTGLLTRSFRFQMVRELCQKSEQMQVLTLAGSLETGTLNPQGKQVRIGALVRLEQSLVGQGGARAELPAYRLTVRAVHPGCALAVFRALKHQLLAS